ncbi:MAG: hypothetical protein QOE61_4879 [Micromonosporaceae bacterium]|jgi:hypothetical protein|nr:hypothetical protein [Micromonosporaceae bacterium]
MAARPITLRLLLSVNGSAELPSSRIDVYRVGVEGLAAEWGERRREQRRTGPPLDRLLTAAKRLAAITLLTGRPRVARRRTPFPKPGQVVLDSLIREDVSPDDLEAMLDSALFTGGADARRWIHRSVEEYLCAEQLRTLPIKAALALLADPSDPSRLLPQLAEVGAWLAAANVEWFEWMLTHEPESLVNADLRSRGNEGRRRVGQALLTHLGGGDVPDARLTYCGLAYDGLEADVRPFLDPTQPAAIRREAVLIAAATDLRDVDRPLLDLIDAVIEAHGPEDYDDEVQIGCYAAHAVAGSPDQELVDKLKAIAADVGAPYQLRMSLFESLWPTRLSTQDLLAAVTGDERTPSLPGFGRRMIHLFERAISAGRVQPRDLLPWFSDGPSHHDSSYNNLAGRAVLDVVFSVEPGQQLWDEAVASTIRGMHESVSFFAWTSEELKGIGDDRRRAFAADVLMGRRDERGAAWLLDAGVIRTEDLGWWVTELAGGLTADSPAALSARIVLDHLVWRINDEEARSARQLATTLHVPATVVEDLFGDAAVTSRRDQEALAAQEERDHNAKDAAYRFSVERLDATLDAGDFAAVVDELERQTTVQAQGRQPINAWPALDEEQRQRVAAAAAQYLRQEDLDAADYETSANIVAAHAILAIRDQTALDDVPPEPWLEWLPHLLETPAAYATALFAQSRSLAVDRQRTDEILIEQLRRDVARGHSGLIHRLGGYQSTALSQAALDLATVAEVDPRSLAGLLGVAAATLPAEASDAALAHLRRRLTFQPMPDADGEQQVDNTERQAQERAVGATAALAHMPGLQAAFPEILGAFRQDTSFARATIAKVSAQGPAAWQALTPEQVAALYLWARDALPPTTRVQPGTVYTANPVERFPDEVLARLTNMPDPAAVQALDEIDRTTGDIWLRRAARLARASAKADAWQPPAPAEVLAALDGPALRIVATSEQLAQLILEELDTLVEDIQRDRAVKALFWHRQRRMSKWMGYAPPGETELSDRLARELERRVKRRVVMLREVEIQPRLAASAGDVPDLLALAPTASAGTVELPIEVKCNWHREVITAIETQLGDRYLCGPYGSTGIYIVGYYDGDAWVSNDSRRDSAKKGRDGIVDELEKRSRTLAERGITAHVRVLDLSLDKNSLEEADEGPPKPSADDLHAPDNP